MKTIETTLTPQQAVLAWMTRAHRFGSFEEYCHRDTDQSPLYAISRQVCQAIEDSMKGRSKDEIYKAVRQGQLEAAFLFYLHWSINSRAIDESASYSAKEELTDCVDQHLAERGAGAGSNQGDLHVRVREAIQKLIDDGCFEKGTAVELPVPIPFLADAPLIQAEWIDAHVVALAEWGATLTSDDVDFDHGWSELAWPRFVGNSGGSNLSVDETLLQSTHEAAAKRTVRFPGRSKQIGGRQYFHIDDYRDWPDRAVTSDLTSHHDEGIVIESWNRWVDANGAEGITKLAGITVPKLQHRVSQTDFVVCNDEVRLRERQRDYQVLIDVIARWVRWGAQNVPATHLAGHAEQASATDSDSPLGDWEENARQYLSSLYVADAAAKVISQDYFCGQSVLFPAAQESLAVQVKLAEELIKRAQDVAEGGLEASIRQLHCFDSGPTSACASDEAETHINIDELRRTTEPVIAARVDKLVSMAKAEGLGAIAQTYADPDAKDQAVHLLRQIAAG